MMDDVIFTPLTEDLMDFKRKLIESLYSGTLTAWTETSTRSTNPYSALEEYGKEILLDKVPCRVTRQFGPATERTPKIYETTIRVMLAPEIKIPPGSILTIEFNGHTKDYRQTGEPVIHYDHQMLTCEVYVQGRGNKA